MPRSVVPSYRLHKPTGQARVIIAGRHVYLGKYGSSESRDRYARVIAELHVSPGGPPIVQDLLGSGLTINELCLRYWHFAAEWYVKDGRPSGSIPGIRVSLRLLRRLYGPVNAIEFGPLALQAVMAALIEDGHSRTYVNDHVGRIKRVFKWAASRELVSVTTYQGLATVRGLVRGRTKAREPEPVGPVADEIVEATLAQLNPVVADMVRFQRLTGARPTEVCILRPRDVDRSKEIWEYRPSSHKTQHLGRQRVVYLGPKAQEVLRPYLLRDADSYCFSPQEALEQIRRAKRLARRTRVQPSQQNRRKARPKLQAGERYTKDSYNYAIRRAVNRVNDRRRKQAANERRELEPSGLLPNWSPNRLRHSRATELRRTHGLEAAQVSLGHARCDVTQVYAERDSQLAARVAKECG